MERPSWSGPRGAPTVRVGPGDGGVAIVGSNNTEGATVGTMLEVEHFTSVRHLVSVARVGLTDAAAYNQIKPSILSSRTSVYIKRES